MFRHYTFLPVRLPRQKFGQKAETSALGCTAVMLKPYEDSDSTAGRQAPEARREVRQMRLRRSVDSFKSEVLEVEGKGGPRYLGG